MPKRVAYRDRQPPNVTVHNGLAVYRIGTGDPMLFMPGPHRFQRPGLRSADALIDGAVELGRAVVTFDPPGSGCSTRPARLGMAEMLACTDEALVTAGVEGAVDAIGHSMGGFTLVAYALARPDRVRRLVLVGTGAGAYMQAPGALWNRTHPGFVPMAALGVLQMALPVRAPEQLLRNYIERRSFVGEALSRPTRIGLLDWFRPRGGRTDWHRVARRLDYRPRLHQILAPTLVLCGRHDPQFPLACSQDLARGIPDAELRIFERSGHYPFLEEPAAFWKAVRSLLATDERVARFAATPEGGIGT